MKKLLVFVCMLSLLFSSCSVDDTHSEKYLPSTIFVKYGPEGVITFDYDDERRISSMNIEYGFNKYTYTFVYNSDDTVQSMVYNENSTSSISTMEYTNGHVSSIITDSKVTDVSFTNGTYIMDDFEYPIDKNQNLTGFLNLEINYGNGKGPFYAVNMDESVLLGVNRLLQIMHFLSKNEMTSYYEYDITNTHDENGILKEVYMETRLPNERDIRYTISYISY